MNCPTFVESDDKYNQNVRNIRDKMKNAGLSAGVANSFLAYYRELVTGNTGLIPEKEIEKVDTLPRWEDLRNYREIGKGLLSALVVIKLNGGLGTSMGLDKAKSLLPVKNGLSFIDIIAKQTIKLREQYTTHTPLVFMNSFRTEQDTLDTLDKLPQVEKGQGRFPLSFIQNKVPKISQDDLSPVQWTESQELEWCPPGHGDVYTCLSESGILADLIDSGVYYAFISNADNLGALVDTSILGYMATAKVDFLMEVAERTASDRKGGHLAKDKQGRLLLREVAQCPEGDMEAFQDISKHRFFNTNSIWLDLRSLQKILQTQGGIIKLPLIRNSKHLDPANPASPKVFQLETAMGAAINCFEQGAAVVVPRLRFAPVKKTDDLLALWSDLFQLSDDYEIIPNPSRTLPPILIQLDPKYFGHIEDFRARFPHGAPSLLNCRSLTVKGDVEFGKNVVLSGDVTIENKANDVPLLYEG